MGDFGSQCKLLALDRKTGKVAWSTVIGKSGGGDDYPGPRSTPTVDGRMVFVMGQHGDLVALDSQRGRIVWKKTMKEFGGALMGKWGYSESPLVDGKMLICTPGGSKGTVLALVKTNGRTVWRSKKLTDKATYASLIAVDIAKVRQYIVLTEKSVAGIYFRDGRVVWKIDRPGITAVVPTPLYSDGMVFVTSGYGLGCNGIQILGGRRGFQAKELYSGKQLVNHHGGVIHVDGHVYGIDDRGKMKCVELKTGKLKWENDSVGKGSIAYADGRFVVRGEGGPVALVDASPEGYVQKGRFNQPHRSGLKSWPHPVITGGCLFLRDQDVLLCYDMTGK